MMLLCRRAGAACEPPRPNKAWARPTSAAPTMGLISVHSQATLRGKFRNPRIRRKPSEKSQKFSGIHPLRQLSEILREISDESFGYFPESPNFAACAWERAVAGRAGAPQFSHKTGYNLFLALKLECVWVCGTSLPSGRGGAGASSEINRKPGGALAADLRARGGTRRIAFAWHSPSLQAGRGGS